MKGMLHFYRRTMLAALLSALFPMAASADGDSTVAPDPTSDPLLITAGFLEHHQDLKYRLLGMQAYGRKNYEDAMRFFRRASYFADKPSQGMVAEMYWNGEGTPRDRALAYAWMDLASERGYRGFIGLRERYWSALDEAERARAITEGQAVYARFGDEAAKPRYETRLRWASKQITGSRTGFNRGVKIQVSGGVGADDSLQIDGTKFYDERYWNAKKYWAWQDAIWMKPRIGKVTVGELETVEDAGGSRIPETIPQVDAPEPEVPEAPVIPRKS
jgi:hypothetical protein